MQEKEQAQDSRQDLKNLAAFSASEVRQLISRQDGDDIQLAPIYQDLAERFYSRSINGDRLMSLDYNGVLFVTGIDKKEFTQDMWKVMVKQYHLPQLAEPFDQEKAKKIVSRQGQLLSNVDKIENKINSLQVSISQLTHGQEDKVK